MIPKLVLIIKYAIVGVIFNCSQLSIFFLVGYRNYIVFFFFFCEAVRTIKGKVFLRQFDKLTSCNTFTIFIVLLFKKTL